MEKSIKNILNHSEVSEKAIERYLVERVKARGGVCLKYSNANVTGYPDRVALFPGGRTAWVELKSKGKKPNKVQQIRHAEMERIGHHVYVIDSKAQVDDLINIMSDEVHTV